MEYPPEAISNRSQPEHRVKFDFGIMKGAGWGEGRFKRALYSCDIVPVLIRLCDDAHRKLLATCSRYAERCPIDFCDRDGTDSEGIAARIPDRLCVRLRGWLRSDVREIPLPHSGRELTGLLNRIGAA